LDTAFLAVRTTDAAPDQLVTTAVLLQGP